MKNLLFPTLGLLALAVVGCKSPESYAVPAATSAPDSAKLKEAKTFRPGSAAGVPINQPGANPQLWAQNEMAKSFSTRPDPFALHPREKAFEIDQTSERVFDSVGGWTVNFVPEEEKIVVPVMEPQPYRRLAGVIVADSILALIDMGNGQLQLIRPGQEIDGWRVVSIDGDKAILRRGGDKLPHEITVRLETPPPGATGSGVPGGPGNPGGSTGTAPGKGKMSPAGAPGSGGPGPSGGADR